MFQWVDAQFEYLCQQDRDEDIVVALHSYGIILERVLSRRNTSRDIAIPAFSWFLYAREKMPLGIFLSAVFAQTTVAGPNRSQEE